MTCIFLWFCVMIYPYRRRQNLKALIRVKSYVNESYLPNQDEKTNKSSDLVSLSIKRHENVDNKENNNIIINKNDKTESSKTSIDERKLYDPLKEVPTKQDGPFLVPPQEPENMLDKTNVYDSHKENQIVLSKTLQTSKNKGDPIKNSKYLNDTAREKTKDRNLNYSDEHDLGLQRTTSMKLVEIKNMSASSKDIKADQPKVSFMNRKDAALRLEISSDMLNQPSSQSINKIRREAVVEAPTMSTYL